MIQTKRQFHLGDILSITTGCLLPPGGLDGVYAILKFMTRDDVYTNQIPRFCDECRPYLFKQHPQLKNVDASNVNPINCKQWIEEQIEIFGEYLEVEVIPMDDHKKKDYVEELKEQFGENNVIEI